MDSAAGYKFINTNDSTTTDVATGQTFASLSLRHDSGLGGTVGYTRQDVGPKSGSGIKSPEGYYAKLGYDWNAFGIAADWTRYENPIIDPTRNKLTSYGVGGQWNATDGITLGVAYHNFQADIAGVSNMQDIDVVMMGMKVVF